jgi:hypothetical protein
MDFQNVYWETKEAKAIDQQFLSRQKVAVPCRGIFIAAHIIIQCRRIGGKKWSGLSVQPESHKAN